MTVKKTGKVLQQIVTLTNTKENGEININSRMLADTIKSICP